MVVLKDTVIGGLNSIATWFTNLSDIIGSFKNSFIEKINSILNYLNPASENFLLKPVVTKLEEFKNSIFTWFTNLQDKLDNLKASFIDNIVSFKNSFIEKINNILSYLNPASENFLLKPVVNLFTTVISYLNPFSDNFLLKIAFVPDSEYFDTLLGNFNDNIKQKFIFFHNITEFFERVKNLSTGSSTAPTFELTLPQKYGGGTHSIVDFTMFADYRIYILNFQRCIMWFFFAKGIFKSLPKTIRQQ